jgi:hypothetical protein
MSFVSNVVECCLLVSLLTYCLGPAKRPSESEYSISYSGRSTPVLFQINIFLKFTPAFEEGEEVCMVVKETTATGETRSVKKKFVIVEANATPAGSWVYKLKPHDSEDFWENGKWFPESRLQWA